MSTPTRKATTSRSSAVDHLDIVVIGAGISGIGAARYIATELPSKTFTVLEGRSNIGGTWDLFRYPGIRSDSDLHTFGYEFKAWRHESAIADAPLIREYLAETVDENALRSKIRLNHKVVHASWSSEDARWTLTVEITDPDTDARRESVITANWVFASTGYYNYEQGYLPEFPGSEKFQGTIVHPQHWPEGLDYADKKVVVIGSGATAVTIVPSMARGEGDPAKAAAHVTMLQRTPTYIMSLPRVDGVAVKLTKYFGEQRGYALTRFKNVWTDWAVVHGLRRFPKLGRKFLRRVNAKALPAGFEVDKHFNPPYNPWDQRLCVAPDGDLFAVLSDGSASVVTDTIDTFTEKGIRLSSGEELEADIIVTATGLNLRLFGGIELDIDGRPVDVSESICYRGMLLSGIPNWAMAIGYTTSSWTLKVSLMCKYFLSLVQHMDAHGYDTAVAIADPGMQTRPVMDISAGYALRAADQLPKQGQTKPWRMAMGYQEDARLLKGAVVDENLHLSSSRDRVRTTVGAGRA
ncbi:NAD(P)/FAD-dependent oxidoreductase [Williamsia sp. CHRR-6]|uniref:flavin-containing monooxygenase n=1 Tax=Williamsia sp. CHRR-6 TaxID=2835871 RepID=UPI001BD980A5|nr:NAD(P)/FAD-dependent oxidoreductase [Williamsia sp. CHRR-6]MBT0566938.1 NAD(P)/FAD-dependent oxidoreductase [Williamsia sp. CHRR-6]